MSHIKEQLEAECWLAGLMEKERERVQKLCIHYTNRCNVPKFNKYCNGSESCVYFKKKGTK